jgi:hypothetical protein
MVTGMNAWQQQQVDELRSRIGACMRQRETLEGTRTSPAGATSIADQIRRIDADIAEHCRNLGTLERKFRDGP